uniref:Uncharacterized protein n=1 Tax=Rhizophora mucronata TaxID=61149 RepID=A0A2P2PYF3_RHIMU
MKLATQAKTINPIFKTRKKPIIKQPTNEKWKFKKSSK